MTTCPACNGIIGRDCFNPQECMEITQAQAANYRDQQECDEWQKLRHDNHQLRERLEHIETQLCCAADLLNTWCREAGVEECRNPRGDMEFKEAIDRLWGKVSSRHVSVKAQSAATCCPLCNYWQCLPEESFCDICMKKVRG